MKPTICHIVIYKSKIDNGPGNDVISPAMIIRTRDTTVPAVIERWGPEPRTVHSETDPSVTHQTAARPDSFVADLPDQDTVDLVVFGLGKIYHEYAVTRGNGRGQWSWPPRTSTQGRAAYFALSEEEREECRAWLREHGLDPSLTPVEPDVFAYDEISNEWLITQRKQSDKAKTYTQRVAFKSLPPAAMAALISAWGQRTPPHSQAITMHEGETQ